MPERVKQQAKLIVWSERQRCALAQARGTILSFLTAAAVLSIISTDRTYNISHNVHGRDFSAVRSAFAGFLVSATADLALIYHLGIIPQPRPQASQA